MSDASSDTWRRENPSTDMSCCRFRAFSTLDRVARHDGALPQNDPLETRNDAIGLLMQTRRPMENEESRAVTMHDGLCVRVSASFLLRSTARERIER